MSLSETDIHIPLTFCLDSLFTDKGESLFEFDTVRKILTTILSDPTNTRYQSLNATKVLPRLTSPNLAPWYVLRHAGFAKVGDRLVLVGGVNIDKIQAVLTAIQEAEDRANKKQSDIQAAYDAELAAADARLAERIALRRAEEEERNRLQAIENEKQAQLQAEKDAKAKEDAALQPPQEHIQMNDGEVKLPSYEDIIQGDATTSTTTTTTTATNVPLTNEEQMLADEQLARELQAQLDEEAQLDRDEEQDQAKTKPAAMDSTMTDEEIDPEILKIAAAARARAKNQATAGLTAKQRLAPGEKPLSEMTREEKMVWLEKKKAQNKIRAEHRKNEENRNKYLNQKNLVHAQQDLQERLEMAQMRDAAALKAKEERERIANMNRLRAKAAADKERRKKEAEERAREIERIRAAKAASGK